MHFNEKTPPCDAVTYTPKAFCSFKKIEINQTNKVLKRRIEGQKCKLGREKEYTKMIVVSKQQTSGAEVTEGWDEEQVQAY